MWISSGAIHWQAFHLECFHIELEFRNVDFFPTAGGRKTGGPKGEPQGEGTRAVSTVLENAGKLPRWKSKSCWKIAKNPDFQKLPPKSLDNFYKNINLKLYISFLTIIATIGQKNSLRFD